LASKRCEFICQCVVREAEGGRGEVAAVILEGLPAPVESLRRTPVGLEPAKMSSATLHLISNSRFQVAGPRQDERMAPIASVPRKPLSSLNELRPAMAHYLRRDWANLLCLVQRSCLVGDQPPLPVSGKSFAEAIQSAGFNGAGTEPGYRTSTRRSPPPGR
jgi:hypothetical protein